MSDVAIVHQTTLIFEGQSSSGDKVEEHTHQVPGFFAWFMQNTCGVPSEQLESLINRDVLHLIDWQRFIAQEMLRIAACFPVGIQTIKGLHTVIPTFIDEETLKRLLQRGTFTSAIVSRSALAICMHQSFNGTELDLSAGLGVAEARSIVERIYPMRPINLAMQKLLSGVHPVSTQQVTPPEPSSV